MSTAVLAVTRHLSVREVLQVIVRGAAALLEARYAALGVPDDVSVRPDGSAPAAASPAAVPRTNRRGPGRRRATARSASFAEFVVEGVSDEEWAAIGSLPRQHGLLAVMLREGKPQRLTDIRADPRFEGWPAAHPVLEDFLGVPIRDGEDVIGIIFLANKRRPGGFTERDEELLTLFAAHAAIAVTNARLYERSRELTVIEERTRLARDLHDAVAQKLFSLRLTAQAAAALAGSDPARAVGELDRVQALAAEALAELRAAIFELRPAELIDDGLAESLRKHVEVLDRVHAARLVFRAEGRLELPPDREAAAFRIAQEAVYNALRHAGARQITVRLTGTGGTGSRRARSDRREPAGAVLEISDDGRGFDANASGVDGLGLASMRERARDAGGTLTVSSAPGAGTRVRLALPVTRPPTRPEAPSG